MRELCNELFVSVIATSFEHKRRKIQLIKSSFILKVLEFEIFFLSLSAMTKMYFF